MSIKTQFDSNTFESDYIIKILSFMVEELKTKEPVERIIDKYAIELTAFMNGQIEQAVKINLKFMTEDKLYFPMSR